MKKIIILLIIIACLLLGGCSRLFHKATPATIAKSKSDIDLLDWAWSKDLDIGYEYTDFTGDRRTAHIALEFYFEYSNGGLCQFLCNSSKEVVLLFGDALQEIGAEDCKKQLEEFFSKQSIDVNDLSEFETEGYEEYIAIYNRYPFEEFENEFDYTGLQRYLATYIREHIELY